jgi:hypothetical protein
MEEGGQGGEGIESGAGCEERRNVERCWAVNIEEEGWVSGWRRESGEVDGFLGPVVWVTLGSIGGFRPMSEAWVIWWLGWGVCGGRRLVEGCGCGGYVGD